MALIQCPACKQDVNDKASYCPICGYALKDKGHREAQDAKPDLTTVGAESKDENIDMSEKEPEPWVSENSASGVKVSESQAPVSEIKETSEDAVLGTSSAKANPDVNQQKEAKPKEAANAQKDLFARKREICDAILFDPDKLNALIGKNGEYYSAEFKAIRSGQKGRFNIPAFLLNVGHTLYRKNLYIFLRWQLPWLIASFIVQILLWLSIGQIFDGGIVSGTAILITCTVLYIAVAIAGLVICIITGKRFNSVFMRQLESAILSSCTEQDTDVNVFLYNHMDLCRKWKCGAGFPLLYVAGSVTASLLIYFIGIQTVTFGTSDSAALWNLLSSDDGYGQTYEKEYDPYAGSNSDSTYGSEDSGNAGQGSGGGIYSVPPEDLYAGVLQSLAYDETYNSGWGGNVFYDINNDGLQELIVRRGTCEGDATCTIYTYQNDTLCILGEVPVGNALLVTDGGAGIVVYGAHMGYEWATRITYEAGQLYTEPIFERELGPEEEYTDYGTYLL